MANDNICVFCGQKYSPFRMTTIQCGATVQNACKTCEKEMKLLDEVELCRRAMVRGLAEHPDRLAERIQVITEAENHRPTCLRCGHKLVFTKVQELDNSPLRDSLFKEPFEVLPAFCEACGKYEFYNPGVARKNKYMAYLIWKDKQKTV